MQTMDMKQNQPVFHGKYSNLTRYIFCQRILKYLNALKPEFLSFMTKVTQTMEMKQRQAFSIGHIQI